MKNSNIYIISDNKEFAEKKSAEISLSRKNDNIEIVGYNRISSILNNSNADVIIMHVEKKEQAENIRKIKNNSNTRNCSVIVLSEFKDSEFLCRCYDLGADDFLDAKAEEPALFIRIMWSLKNKMNRDKNTQKSDILAIYNITDRETGFYKENCTSQIFEREYKRCITNYRDAIFMMISTDLSCRSGIDIKDIARLIKQITRTSDLKGFVSDDIIYLMLFGTKETGARKLFEKVNNMLTFDCSVSASAMKISDNDSFSGSENSLKKMLKKSLAEGNSFSFLQTENKVINDKKTENNTNIGFKNFENIIKPTFFKIQSIYEPKFYNTEIKQLAIGKERTFIIKNRENKSVITVNYSDLSAIVITTEEVFKKQTRKDEKVYSAKELTESKLENIVLHVAERFRKNLYGSVV